MSIDVDALIASLTLEEKCSLTAGEDLFTLRAIEHAGIPKIRVTDGPSGARGIGLPGGDDAPSNCIPCGAALGATWDPELVERIGEVVGRDVRGQGCRGLLAPTVNLHRAPLAGRNFECYSEDPLLTGRLAAGFIRGAQSHGVFATIKHFVGNEAEFERNTIDSRIDDRALRELYLLPFEMAVKEAGVLGVMTSYNRMNGDWLNMQRRYLMDLLRDEWGFTGLVMTDWFATADREQSLAAGLDLEMPGPGRALGPKLAQAVQDGKVPEADLDAALRRQLHVYAQLGVLGGATDPIAPLPQDETTDALLRAAGAAASVLLTNDGVLPLDPAALRSVAIIGPRGYAATITGGGSAQLNSHRVVQPADELIALLGPGVTVSVQQGAADPTPTILGQGVLRAPDGFHLQRYGALGCAGEPVSTGTLREAKLMEAVPSGGGTWSARLTGTVVPLETGPMSLQLAQSGAARVWVDGALVLDGVEHPPPPGGSEFFGLASKDLVAEVQFVAGRPTEVVVEFDATGTIIAGFRVAAAPVDEDALMERAVAAAAAADVAVLLVGTTGQHETEARDRPHLRLPGRQDELIRRVAAANHRTVVVLNAAGVLEMPWAGEVGAIVQCWFGGHQMGGAIADVVVGRREPGGRLPTTIPYRLEHNPAHDNFAGENGQLRYGEGVFMGYRGYEHRCIEPRFPFGHGGSYTRFEVGTPTVSGDQFRAGERLVVSVPVANVGERNGSEVVQVYVAPRNPRLARPPKELKGFAKVHLDAGERTTAQIALDERAFMYYDPGQPDWDDVRARANPMFMGPDAQERRSPRWQLDPGTYDIVIGRSSTDIVGTCTIEVLGD